MKTLSLDLSQNCEPGFSIFEEERFFPPLFISLNQIPITNRIEFVLTSDTLGKTMSHSTHGLLTPGTPCAQLELEPLCLLQSFLVTYCDRDDVQNWFGVKLGLIFLKKEHIICVLKLCQVKHHLHLCNGCLYV